MGTARRSGSGSLAVGHIRAANCRHLPLPLRALQLSTTAEKRKWHFLADLADLAGWQALEAPRTLPGAAQTLDSARALIAQ